MAGECATTIEVLAAVKDRVARRGWERGRVWGVRWAAGGWSPAKREREKEGVLWGYSRGWRLWQLSIARVTG